MPNELWSTWTYFCLRRDQCEELRSTRSKRMHDQVVIERMEQLALKEERDQRDRMEEQMFADLWHADMMAKVCI